MNITDVGHLVSDGDEGEDKMVKANIEKISENEDVNELYNILSFGNQANNRNLKINIIDGKEKDSASDKDKENNENEQNNLQGSSIMNIFISPNITVTNNTFLSRKTERDK